MNHLFVTQDYGPDRGGMARRHVELCRRFGDGHATRMAVSTVSLDGAEEFDRGEHYPIHRQPFHYREANRFVNDVRWARWLSGHDRRKVDVIHCGNLRPAGYPVMWARARLGIPYLVYVYGGDLLRERRKAAASPLKRLMARRILEGAAGIVAISEWGALLVGEVMEEIGVRKMPPVGSFHLGTDPVMFSPGRNAGKLRARWGVGDSPLIITVARLVPHKGQDMGIRALSLLKEQFPDLRYLLVGDGHDGTRLCELAREVGVADRLIFAGALPDSELPEAYATSTIYLGASRVDNEVNVEGFGISFIEASSSGLPVVAGDSGGVRSAVRDGITGVVVPSIDPDAIAAALRSYLDDDERRRATGAAGRRAVETHYNWDRVARETREFTYSVIGERGSRS